jgi:hypothetical protein
VVHIQVVQQTLILIVVLVLITGYTDSPFSLINEGSGQGIVIRARNPLNYGAIGDLAFDISNSSNASNTVGDRYCLICSRFQR